jgi:hypothetical protein
MKALATEVVSYPCQSVSRLDESSMGKKQF